MRGGPLLRNSSQNRFCVGVGHYYVHRGKSIQKGNRRNRNNNLNAGVSVARQQPVDLLQILPVLCEARQVEFVSFPLFFYQQGHGNVIKAYICLKIAPNFHKTERHDYDSTISYSLGDRLH